MASAITTAAMLRRSALALSGGRASGFSAMSAEDRRQQLRAQAIRDFHRDLAHRLARCRLRHN
jgi:hypothetical protein